LVVVRWIVVVVLIAVLVAARPPGWSEISALCVETDQLVEHPELNPARSKAMKGEALAMPSATMAARTPGSRTRGMSGWSISRRAMLSWYRTRSCRKPNRRSRLESRPPGAIGQA